MDSVERAWVRREEGGKNIPSRVHTNGSLTDNSQLGQLLFVNRLLAIGRHDSQGTRRDKGRARTESPASRDGSVHENLHALGLEILSMLLAQQLQSAAQARLEVVGPFVNGSVDVNLVIGNVELAGLELGVLDVGDLDPEGALLGSWQVGGDGDDGVGGDGHGKHRVQGVVDVLADDVHSAGGARHELGLVAVGGLKLGEEVVPSFLLRGEGIGCVDVLERVGDGDGAGHCECYVEEYLLNWTSQVRILPSEEEIGKE